MEEEFILRKMSAHGLEIRKMKKKLGSYYQNNYKTLLRFCDILIIFAVLFNFGAVAITNMLVVKVNPELVLYEVNPAVGKSFGYEDPVENEVLLNNGKTATVTWKAVIIHLIKIMCLVFWYIWLRLHIFCKRDIWLTAGTSIMFFVLLGWDFSNDLGFWIGKLIWGA